VEVLCFDYSENHEFVSIYHRKYYLLESNISNIFSNIVVLVYDRLSSVDERSHIPTP
jgi:hypothetical protein